MRRKQPAKTIQYTPHFILVHSFFCMHTYDDAELSLWNRGKTHSDFFLLLRFSSAISRFFFRRQFRSAQHVLWGGALHASSRGENYTFNFIERNKIATSWSQWWRERSPLMTSWRSFYSTWKFVCSILCLKMNETIFNSDATAQNISSNKSFQGFLRVVLRIYASKWENRLCIIIGHSFSAASS